jgi:hypothetical protein
MNRALILCLTCLSLYSSADAQGNSSQSAATKTDKIALVKGTMASTLDRALPEVRLEDWLLEEVGTNAEFRWALRYQPPKPGGPIYDFPNWVGADIVMLDGRTISILVGFHSPEQRPYFYSADVVAGRRITRLHRLSDLSRLLRETS